MPVTTGSKLQYEYMIGGGSPMLITAVAQTDTTGYIAGMPMQFDATGEWCRAATGQLGPSANFADGIATHGYPGASEPQTCVLITPHTVFSAVVAHATTASAVTGSTLIGNTYPIESCATLGPAASGTFQMGIASTDESGGFVIGLKDPAGTAYGRVYFIFQRTYSTESPFYAAT